MTPNQMSGATFSRDRRVRREHKLQSRFVVFGGTCWICKRLASEMDHVKPKSAGGAEIPANRRLICSNCNSIKAAKWPLSTEDIISIRSSSLTLPLRLNRRGRKGKKFCSKCSKWKHRTDFAARGDRLDSVRCYCRTCSSPIRIKKQPKIPQKKCKKRGCSACDGIVRCPLCNKIRCQAHSKDGKCEECFDASAWTSKHGFKTFQEVDDIGITLKQVPGHLGYFASSDGSVWSQRDYRGGLRNVIRRLEGHKDKDGYLTVGLCVSGKYKTRRVSHIILESFTGPRPFGFEACHFPDSSVSNNRPENLKWDTHERNIFHKFEHGTVARGDRHGMAKLSDKEARSLILRRLNGEKLKNLAEEFNLSTTYASTLCNGKNRPCALKAALVEFRKA